MLWKPGKAVVFTVGLVGAGRRTAILRAPVMSQARHSQRHSLQYPQVVMSVAQRALPTAFRLPSKGMLWTVHLRL